VRSGLTENFLLDLDHARTVKSSPRVTVPSSLRLVLFLVSFAFCAESSWGGTEKDFFEGSDLSNANNYNPAGVPTNQNDVLLTTTSNALSGSLTVNSLSQTNSNTYTMDGVDVDTTSVNSISGSFDAVYLGGNATNLTIGTLVLDNTIGALNVAQPNAVLTINQVQYPYSLYAGTLVKTGSGTLNVTHRITTSNSASFSVLGGTTNFNDGFISQGGDLTGGLLVGNPNTGQGSAVVLNVNGGYISTSYLDGTIAKPSSGVNTATINLNTGLRDFGLAVIGIGTHVFEGDIAGAGGVAFANLTQVLSGHYTYSGVTVVEFATLEQDGTGANQGEYDVNEGTLSGNGTIGLTKNAAVNNSSTIAPGNPSDPLGTLTVKTSGTGGVVFHDGSILSIQVSGAGSSSRLAITRGSLVIGPAFTARGITLQLLPAGSDAFDGSSYTIATFDSESGTFSSVTGLPSDYEVVYEPTDIMLVPIPEPHVWALCVIGCGALMFARRNAR
jgi:hypothetical protein